MKREEVIQYVNDNKDRALEKAGLILGRKINMQSFNGIIGGKNAIYDVDPLDYETPENYIKAWMQSHQERYNDEKYAPYEKSSHRVHNMLQDDFLKKYIENYLARTYFNKHE